MKVIIEVPSWLGDAVMITPAIENLVNCFKDIEITLIGSFVSVEVLKNHPKVTKTFILDKTLFNLFKTLVKVGEFDAYFSFRGSLRSKLIKFCIRSKIKYQFDKNHYSRGHQVEKYNNFINDCMNANLQAGKLKLYNYDRGLNKKNKLLGINPGASYGSAKRWYPKEFAEVASELSRQYDIIIFGGFQEIDLAADIEKYLNKKGIVNYQNLAGKTSIDNLIRQISNLDLLITGDSGPMHLAAVFEIPTVTIFGPTKDQETSQWLNERGISLKKNLECQPCMKRTCPLQHHNCMKLIKSSDVLKALKKIT
jgi:heptosyltransferase II